VSNEDLRAIYQMARCLVVPSLFEANSLPIFEAWAEGIPVASSNVTALPEQVGDAGLLFDPMDPHDMGGVIERLFTDDALCARPDRERQSAPVGFRLPAHGPRQPRHLPPRGRAPSRFAEDAALLAHDWMRYPIRD
jgi:glycosyltransferase involved in cell wall biosynthesis